MGGSEVRARYTRKKGEEYGRERGMSKISQKERLRIWEGKRLGAVPEIIEPVFTKTRAKCSFSMTEIERFVLVSENTWSINKNMGGSQY